MHHDESTRRWYTSIPYLGPHQPTSPLTPAKLASFTSHASLLYISETRAFDSSEASFLHRILQSGTLPDRLSALTLLVQSSPVHNTKALEILKGMAERGKGKGGREESLKALRCVVDWWVGGGAPPRKLKSFSDQPLCHPSVTDQHFLVWYFEDWLKKYFFSILQILETLSLDPLSYVRTQALTLIFTLLRDKPEQEQNLLRLLVNKLGDTEKSLCSRASYYLLQLLQTHPAMKTVVVREIVALVLRPPSLSMKLSSSTPKSIQFLDKNRKMERKVDSQEAKNTRGNTHARYYSIITLNQILLTPADRDVAAQLIHVYFEMFRELLGEGNEINDAGAETIKEERKEPKKDRKGRVKDRSKKKARAKTKEVKGAAGFLEIEDADSKLISAILTGVNRALPFAKLDSGDARLNKHIDTLFFITHTSTFNISLQALVLLQQISVSLSSSSSPASKSVIDRYYRTLYTSLDDVRLATSAKQAMYLNLLFKSIKADPDRNGERIKALVRRFVQVLVSGGSGSAEFVAGGLFVLGELFATTPGLRTMLNTNNFPGKVTDIDEKGGKYDPHKRDPQYAHASSSPMWELTPLLHHYHPAISLHARQLLSGQPLTTKADLSLNTLSHFLDRFVYKNPKKVKPSGSGKGGSAMQPAASRADRTGVKLVKGVFGVSETAVNEEEFLKTKTGDVPVDLLFFHKFFSRKREKEKARSAKVEKRRKDRHGGTAKNDSEEDEEGLDSDNEAKIWKAMKASMPAAVGDEELLSESDNFQSDLEEEVISYSEDEDEEDEDDMSMEGTDDQDLVLANGGSLIEFEGDDSDEDQENGGWATVPTTKGERRKRKAVEETKGMRSKRVKSLPTFATYENYAKMIEDGPDDNI